MKLSNRFIRFTAFFFALMVLLQSCATYQKSPIPVQNAIDNKHAVKLVSTNGTSYEFHSLAIYNNELIGMTADKKTIAKIEIPPMANTTDNFNRYRLDPNKIASVYPLKERDHSFLKKILFPAAVLGVIFIISPDAILDLIGLNSD